jgi:RHS repeat-associated protein
VRGSTPMRIFSYDAAGNVIQDLRGPNAYNYAINDAGRIKWVTGAGTASYLYDGFQKLRYKSQGGTVANYLWDAFGHIIAEHNGAGGAALREYIWLGDTPLAVNEGVNLSYVHPDHLDRPVAMTTSGGPAIAWSARYDPFGNVVSITSPTAMPLRFPGQYFQIEDGLSYNWHRNYDPSLGRYSQADPLGFVDGPGVYNYVGQSPGMKVDPSGRMGGQSRRPTFPCGRCTITYDYDNQKGKHTHWNCPGQPQGCIKNDGSLCDGSAPPPENVKQCLRDKNRVPANYSYLGLCLAATAAGACILAPEICIPGLVIGGGTYAGAQ